MEDDVHQEPLTDTDTLRRHFRLLDKVQTIAQIGAWELDLQKYSLSWTGETYRIHGVTPATFQPTVDLAIGFYTAETRPQIRRALVDASAIAAQQYDLELQIRRQDGVPRWVRVTGRRADDEGHPELLCGVIQDITERRALEEAIVGIAQREQTRLGIDLHDGLGQELTGAALILNGVMRSLPTSAAASRNDIMKVESLIREAINTCRFIAQGLSPAGRERGGLVGAVQELAARVATLHPVKVEVRIRGRRWMLDDAVNDHLFRIAQEAVTNALKHARAQRIMISLQSNAVRTFVSVTNDQHGVASTLGNGMGVKIMQYRARLVGGSLSIRDFANGGRRVRCCVPMTGGGDGRSF